MKEIKKLKNTALDQMSSLQYWKKISKMTSIKTNETNPEWEIFYRTDPVPSTWRGEKVTARGGGDQLIYPKFYLKRLKAFSFRNILRNTYRSMTCRICFKTVLGKDK